MKLYLARHTSVDVPKGICYGQTDVPLNASFEAEAEMLRKQLENIHADAVFSSPLTRCTQLASFCGFPDVKTDMRLKELHFGDWEMEIWDDLDMRIWVDDWVNIPAPNGESFRQLYERVVSFIEEQIQIGKENVLVFTHGGVINCARVYFGLTDWKGAFDQLPQYGELFEFQI